MMRLLREPLVHFLGIGVAIFALHGWLAGSPLESRGEIRITRGQIAAMAENFARTWQRPPSPSELQGLIEDRIREEVYSREARALGLDQDDTVIRRRLRQKLEFVAEDVASHAEPTEAELAAYLADHTEQFREPARFDFRQIFLSPAKRGADLERDAAQLLEQLRKSGEAADAALGDSSLLGSAFEGATSREVAALFGDAFATELSGLEAGAWHGPIASAYGKHLVWVDERTEGRIPALAEVREAVRRALEGARRVEANERLYREMRARYRVAVEGAEGGERAAGSP
jgi:hypothetical protein